MYNDIKLEKGLYSITGKTFTEALTALDPDKAYKGTDMEELDAFERQLKRFDIKVSGEDCSMVESFFVSTESAVLFPEYVRRQIKLGMDEASILPVAAAAQTYTDSVDFRALTLTTASTKTADEVAVGAALNDSTVGLASTASALKKYGRKLSCSYEAIRKQRLEAFGVILRAMGAKISRSINKALITALKSTTNVTNYSTLDFSAVSDMWGAMTDYDMDVLLCSPSVMASIMALDEMKLCVSDFAKTGRAVTPYGLTLVKCQGLDSGVAIGLDSKVAVEVVYGTDVIVDFDKLIGGQCEEIAASILCGFSVITSDAVRKLAKQTA